LKKYIISIENGDSPRLANFFSQSIFKKYQTEFQKFGIRGADLPTAEYFKLAVLGKKRILSPAELGCTLSHVAALKNFLKSNELFACIFEDDAICLNDFDLNDLDAQVDALNIPPRFFLSLGGIQLKSNSKVRGKLLDVKLQNTKVLAVDSIYLGHFFYAYAYIVDREMAKTLIEYHEKPMSYDNWTRILDLNPDVKFYATYLFDHPELNDDLLNKSYLEQERRALRKFEQPKKKNWWQRWRISLLKKIYMLLLRKY